MKINLLDIKGFGKLSQMKILPKDGFNIVFEKNESGKSTLQAFIRAMLYGLKGGRKSKEGNLAPLKHYKPWNKDQYSGIMEYSLDNGKAYRIGRNFEKGTTNIYDDGANNLTSKFPHDKDTGPRFALEHLFIDADVFERSAFIGQLQSVIDEEGKKGLIEKLSNLSTTGSEDMSVECAINALELTLLEKVGTKNSSKRPLDKLNSRILELKQERADLKAQREKYMSILSELRNDENALSELEDKLAELKAQKESIKKRELLSLQNELNGLLAKINDIDESIKECNRKLISLKHYESIDQESFSEILQLVNEEKQIEYSILSQTIKLKEMKDSYEEIKDLMDPDELFDKKTNDVQQAIIDYNEAKTEKRKNIAPKAGAGNTKIGRDWLPFIVPAGLLSSLLLTVNFFHEHNPLFLALALAAAVFSVTLLLIKKNKHSNSKSISDADQLNHVLFKAGFTDMMDYIRYREDQVRKREKTKNYSQQIQNLELQIEDLNTRKGETKERWEDFIFKNSLTDDSDKNKVLEPIRQGLEAKKETIEKKQRLLLQKDTINDKREIVLREAGLMAGEIFFTYEDLNKFILDLSKEDNNNIVQISMEQLQGAITIIERKINETKLSMATKEARIEKAPDQTKAYNVFEELSRLREKKEKLELQGQSLALASQLIKKVALIMQRDYIPKLNSEMSKMMEKLSDRRYTKVMTNDELVINVVSPETEQLIGVNSLSGGTIDQIYLSMRLSAVTLMEEGKEKIPLFLDEPFSQYDETRIRKAFELLKDISKERQIFFFTCRQREYEIALDVFGKDLNRISLM